MEEIKGTGFSEATKTGKVLVDFWGKGCGNCKMMEPIIKQLEAEHSEIKFVKVDTEEAKEQVTALGITSLPTIAFFKDGVLVDKLAGLKPKTLIAKKINELF